MANKTLTCQYLNVKVQFEKNESGSYKPVWEFTHKPSVDLTKSSYGWYDKSTMLNAIFKDSEKEYFGSFVDVGRCGELSLEKGFYSEYWIYAPLDIPLDVLSKKLYEKVIESWEKTIAYQKKKVTEHQKTMDSSYAILKVLRDNNIPC